jgi:hypothetical protein
MVRIAASVTTRAAARAKNPNWSALSSISEGPAGGAVSVTVTVTVGDGEGDWLSVIDGVAEGVGSALGSVLGVGVTVSGKSEIGSDTGSNRATFEDGAAKSEESPDGADEEENKTDVELNILHYPT